MRLLVSWIGFTDLGAVTAPEKGPGPILRLLRHDSAFEEVHLLNDVLGGQVGAGEAPAHEYVAWLAVQTGKERGAFHLHDAEERLHNQYGQTYVFTRDRIRELYAARPGARWALLLSPGTPAAQTAMILTAQTLFDPPAELFNTYQVRAGGAPGVERVELPFELRVDAALPMLLRGARRELGPPPEHGAFAVLLGESRALVAAKVQAERAAAYDGVTVLLRGETGTGKELFARAIHAVSPRKDRPLVTVNCAAVEPALAASQLFGHRKGAFTSAVADQAGAVEAAAGGTLFLDEVGDLPADVQVKLLRFLQDHEYMPIGEAVPRKADVRVLAATNVDLEAAVAAGRFRADLFHRLNVVPIYLPPLRERGDDVGLLLADALRRFNSRFGTARRFEDEALKALARRPWPGNVRELEQAVVRLAVSADGDVIGREDVELWLGRPAPVEGRPLRELSPADFMTHLAATCDELLERFRAGEGLPRGSGARGELMNELIYPLLLGRALHAAEGNRTRAGELLGKKTDTSKEPDQGRVARYEAVLQPLIDEEAVRRSRADTA